MLFQNKVSRFVDGDMNGCKILKSDDFHIEEGNYQSISAIFFIKSSIVFLLRVGLLVSQQEGLFLLRVGLFMSQASFFPTDGMIACESSDMLLILLRVGLKQWPTKDTHC